jgi:hypothetical protein
MTLPKELILSQSKEFKIDLLKSISKANDFIGWAELSTIFLDAPIQNGGLSTELIMSIWDKYNTPIK